MSILRSIIGFIFNAVAPFLLVLFGALISGIGLHLGWEILLWTGLIVVGAGIVMGIAYFQIE